MQTELDTRVSEPETDLRAEALRRLEKKRGFRGHLLAYLLVHALLWAIWGVFFVATGAWFPWPLFAMFGWGIGLAFHAWDAFGRMPFTEDEVRREEARLQGHRAPEL